MIFFRFITIFIFLSFSINADQKDSRLDRLFHILSESKNDNEINKIVSNIWDIWMETNDLSIEEDFFRGLTFMQAGNLRMSIEFFTKNRKILLTKPCP